VLEADGFELADCQPIHADGVVKSSANKFTEPFISVTPSLFVFATLSLTIDRYLCDKKVIQV
jgi:hypothetical protein